MLSLAGLTACGDEAPANNPSDPVTIEGAEPAAYTVTLDASLAGWRPIHSTIGAVIVTLDRTEEIGWCGTAEGTGEYYDFGVDAQLVETHFPFTVILCLHTSAETLTVSFDRIYSETETTVKTGSRGESWTGIYMKAYAPEHYDETTGFFSFDVTWENGKALENLRWDRGNSQAEVHLTLDISVINTPK
jgi:hypothetical protein